MTGVKIFMDIEWDDIINIGMVDSGDLPRPVYNVWRCPVCVRVYVFKKGNNSPLLKVYALEE